MNFQIIIPSNAATGETHLIVSYGYTNWTSSNISVLIGLSDGKNQAINLFSSAESPNKNPFAVFYEGKHVLRLVFSI